jgi:hypothetical protein
MSVLKRVISLGSSNARDDNVDDRTLSRSFFVLPGSPTFIVARVYSNIVHAIQISSVKSVKSKNKKRIAAITTTSMANDEAPLKKQKSNLGSSNHTDNSRSNKLKAPKKSQRRQPSLCSGLLSFHFPADVVSISSSCTNKWTNPPQPTPSFSTSPPSTNFIEKFFLAVLVTGEVWKCEINCLSSISSSSIELDESPNEVSVQSCTVVAEDERCSLVTKLRAASECFHIGRGLYAVRSLIEPLQIINLNNNSVFNVMNSNEVSTRVTAITKCSLRNGIICGNNNGEVKEYDMRGNFITSGYTLVGSSSLNEPILRFFTIPSKNTSNDSDILIIVIGIFGAVVIVSNNGTTKRSQLPIADKSNVIVESVDILAMKNGCVQLCYVVATPNHTLYTTDITNLLQCCKGEVDYDDMTLQNLKVPVAGVMAVSSIGSDTYLLDVKHRIYTMEIKQANNVTKNVTSNTKYNPLSEEETFASSLQALLTNIGHVKTQRFHLLTNLCQLDSYLNEVSTAVRWYLRARALFRRNHKPSLTDHSNHLSPLICNVSLLPNGGNPVISAVTGRYILRLTLSGLITNKNSRLPDYSSGSTDLSHDMPQLLPFPESENWRVVIQLRQRSSDSSMQTVCHTIPLRHLLPSMESTTFLHLDRKSMDIDIKTMVSTDIMHVSIQLIYPLCNKNKSREVHLGSDSFISCGMCVPLKSLSFDLIDTCVPCASDISINTIAKTVDELGSTMRADIRHKLSSLEDHSLSSNSPSSTSSSSRTLSGILIKQDISSVIEHLFKQQEDDLQKNEETTCLSAMEIDCFVCGRFVATLLGNAKGFQWEKSSSPGYVASHAMLWGGHRLRLLSRLVRDKNVRSAGKSDGIDNGITTTVWLEIRMTCTDLSRLPMLRSCLMRRIAHHMHKSESSAVENKEDNAINETFNTHLMSIHEDQTLRRIEETLSKCLLRLLNVRKEACGEVKKREHSSNMIKIMSEMKEVAEEVVKSYNILRSLLPDVHF